jgi:hypothetical protein
MTKRGFACSLALSLVALIAAGAAAAEPAIVTGPLQRDLQRIQDFKCMAVNTGNKTENVTFELRNQSGDVLSSASCSLSPTAICAVEGPADPQFASEQIAYCRVSGIKEGSARVTLCVRDFNDGGAGCVIAVTAP